MDVNPARTPDIIEGQLNTAERTFITKAILDAPVKPRVALEIGTWLGGGSTLHILQALEQNGLGHLYGIEASRSIYTQMTENIRKAAPMASRRFTPILGFSDKAIPRLFSEQSADFTVDFAFLDGGNNPMEQIVEFRLLDKHIPVGGQLLAHDARLRKGKFLAPYLQQLDNWEMQVHDLSECGLLCARKLRQTPSGESSNAAGKKLAKLRLEPKEFVLAILPSWLCSSLCKLLPQRVVRSIAVEPRN